MTDATMPQPTEQEIQFEFTQMRAEPWDLVYLAEARLRWLRIAPLGRPHQINAAARAEAMGRLLTKLTERTGR